MMRLVWPILLLVVAAIAAVAQLDRQARYSPGLSHYVPSPARHFAQFHLASHALANGTPEAALVEARELVNRRPMEAAHLRLLAQAQIATGENDAAYAIIQQAAKRGWRDSQTQEAMLAIALSADDHAEAARRLAALWVLDSKNERLSLLAEQVLASEEARQAFADVAADADRWCNRFLQSGNHAFPTEIHADIAARISENR